MDKKEMIKLAITMLESVDPGTIEIVNFDRTEYDDGSTMFNVNLTTPATEKQSKKEYQAAYKEVDRLADFILKDYPNEPGKNGESESAVDVAIRLIGQQSK